MNNRKSKCMALLLLTLIACLQVGCAESSAVKETLAENTPYKGVAGIQVEAETEAETETEEGREKVSAEDVESLPVLSQGETVLEGIEGETEANAYSLVVQKAVLYDNLNDAGVSADEFGYDVESLYFYTHGIVDEGERFWQDDGTLADGVQFLVLDVSITYLNEQFGEKDRVNVSPLLFDKNEIVKVTDPVKTQLGVRYATNDDDAIRMAWLEDPYDEEQTTSVRVQVGETVETRIGFFVPEGNEDLVGSLVHGDMREGMYFFSWEAEEANT